MKSGYYFFAIAGPEITHRLVLCFVSQATGNISVTKLDLINWNASLSYSLSSFLSSGKYDAAYKI